MILAQGLESFGERGFATGLSDMGGIVCFYSLFWCLKYQRQLCHQLMEDFFPLRGRGEVKQFVKIFIKHISKCGALLLQPG